MSTSGESGGIVEDACRRMYGPSWDGPREKQPGEAMKAVWRKLAIAALGDLPDRALSAESRLRTVEAETIERCAKIADKEAEICNRQSVQATAEGEPPYRFNIAWRAISKVASALRTQGVDGEGKS